jgi:hypothetical protein
MIEPKRSNTTTLADAAARTEAKRKAIEARRLYCAAIKAIDVHIRSRASNADYAAALQPFVKAAEMLPVRLSDKV